MNTAINLTTTTRISSSVSKVWEALTKPALIKKYFFDTEVVTDWKKGSPIIWRGIWEGKPYEEKGNVLDVQPGRFLKYNYLSSAKEDKPENYAVITYSLKEANGKTDFTLTQSGFKSEEERDHSAGNWKMVIDGLKNLLEQHPKKSMAE